ncbi:hypothetical protein [Siminovitchia terrae]|uniref:hypothetical protein n=1 Tax=Siminovitchia terrae TaxID=1914933 RepID=UPI0028A9C0E0|nr:hypothetical protein [Siminovitchia terrae]
MARYRKKHAPEEVEAKQFRDDNKNQVFNWVTCIRTPVFEENGKPALMLQTTQGTVFATIGDYIIKDDEGFHVSPQHAFEDMYEVLE